MADVLVQDGNRPRLKSVALPAEHGGWGFLIEPMILGMLVAPSAPGLWLCLAAFGLFLLHQPSKIAIKDLRRGRVFERTRWAARFVSLYGALTIMGLVGAVLSAQSAFWLPLLAALPAAGVQFYFESRNQGRDLLPELLGGITLSATAPMMVLAAGMPLSTALLLWLLLLLRILPSIHYVRVRLRLAKGKPVSPALPILIHVGGLIVALLFVLTNWTGAFVILATALLLARAVYGLLYAPRTTPAKIIGFQEMGFGLAYVILSALAVV